MREFLAIGMAFGLLCIVAVAYLHAEDNPVDCDALNNAAATAESSLQTLEQGYKHACTEDPTTPECQMMKQALDISRANFENAKGQLAEMGCKGTTTTTTTVTTTTNS